MSIVVQGKSRYPAFVEQPSAKFSSGNSQPVLKGRRMAYLNETGDCVEVPVYDGDKMPVGVKLNGPVLVEQRHTTIVVPQGFALFSDENRIFRMEQLN